MDINYKNNRRYNTDKPPRKVGKFINFIIYALCRIILLRKDYTIEKIDMENVKAPYIYLSNHMYFIDFEINAIANYPYSINNIATIDGYYRRPFLMDLAGCICKRKFTTDMSLFGAIKKVLHEYKAVLGMYPEARYTPIGTTAKLPDSLGLMIKRAGADVVIGIHHGNYLHTPFWNYRKKRKVPLYLRMKRVLTKEQIENMSVSEINEIIKKEMYYNEYEYQKNNNIHITEPFRAEGLHKVLYQCPHCMTESKMNSRGSKLFCEHCGKSWELTTLGELVADNGVTEFSSPPEWFEWERSQVRKQIEEGTYHFEDEVDIYSLPRTMRFMHLGKGKLTHTTEGFSVTGHYRGKDYEITRDSKTMYGLHIEYDYCYVRHEDCVDISTLNDSLYCYPTKQNVVTKLSFATEEIYDILVNERRKRKKNR
ncbi:MAG: hypothetical protein E7218_00065 [Anaerofustis stercorihominis]|nr:hypothetical protein [Anaerofustis stercorihominis]